VRRARSARARPGPATLARDVGIRSRPAFARARRRVPATVLALVIIALITIARPALTRPPPGLRRHRRRDRRLVGCPALAGPGPVCVPFGHIGLLMSTAPVGLDFIV
jgi:hypothetical protein